ncbi:MAG: sigma-70 family RNA polymerase sigma factor [Oscillospiraceae bacterium]
MNDDNLLSLLQQNPSEGIKAALSVYGALIKAIISRVLPYNRQDCEECAADVLVALWRHSQGLAHRGTPVKPWLVVTARNMAINRYNKLLREHQMPLNENIEDAKQIMAEETSDGETAMAALIDAMPHPDKEIFIRKYYYMESAEQISQRLNITPQNVYTRLSRGRERLRVAISKEGVAI